MATNEQKILTCGLNLNQRKAADLYRGDKGLNKTECYMKAFPKSSRKSANASASALFALPKVKDYLTQFAVLEALEASMSQQEIVADLITMKDMALGNKDMPIAKITKDGKVIQATVRHFDGSSAGKALELLGKHQKMFTDRVQLDGVIVNLQLDMTGKMRDKQDKPPLEHDSTAS